MTATSWSGLELRHLQALLAVADAGTFSAAAERLGYTQSAVSQQIATLERIVGASLFNRPGGPRPVTLTEAGDALIAHARAVLSRLKAAEADLAALGSGERGTLRVGTLQSVGTKVLPALLRRFGRSWPGIQIVLQESHASQDLLALVGEGELDVTFADSAVVGGPFETRLLLDDPFVFVAPAESLEASFDRVSIADIVGLPLIGTRRHCHDLIENCFVGLTETPRFVFRSDDNTTIQGCIAAGLAYGVLPLLAVDEHDPGIAVIRLDPPVAPRRITAVWHAERRPPASLASFIDAAAEVCAELSSVDGLPAVSGGLTGLTALVGEPGGRR